MVIAIGVSLCFCQLVWVVACCLVEGVVGRVRPSPGVSGVGVRRVVVVGQAAVPRVLYWGW